MSLTKKFALIFSFFALALTATAQTVKVKKETARIKGENLEGFEVELDGTPEEVGSALLKLAKSLGKAKQATDGITINEPTIGAIPYATPAYAVMKTKSTTKAAAWIGMKPEGGSAETTAHVNKELEKIMHDFGVKFYREKIQVQIDESTRAAQAVEKQQQKLVNENKNLNVKVEDNKREKIQLEKSLENNKLQNADLLKRIAKNKHDQDSVALAGVQIKKVMEAQKEKQRKVN
jgi:hypothetical protein